MPAAVRSDASKCGACENFVMGRWGTPHGYCKRCNARVSFGAKGESYGTPLPCEGGVRHIDAWRLGDFMADEELCASVDGEADHSGFFGRASSPRAAVSKPAAKKGRRSNMCFNCEVQDFKRSDFDLIAFLEGLHERHDAAPAAALEEPAGDFAAVVEEPVRFSLRSPLRSLKAILERRREERDPMRQEHCPWGWDDFHWQLYKRGC